MSFEIAARRNDAANNQASRDRAKGCHESGEL
jgi:hypothetical protein